jgi:arginyl-tRNA--protein-N-Asp/Glu arginylyltransferase
MGKIEKIKKEYIGRWIGVKDDELVAVSETHRELYKRLKEIGISGVYVFYSPTEKEKKYGFLF